MRKLGLIAGDIIEIQGDQITVSTVWPAYTEDHGKAIIRMDKIIRRNAKTSIGKHVTIQKARVNPAERITMAPTLQLPLDFIEKDLLKRNLLGHPVSENDIIEIHILVQLIPFIVLSTKPDGIVLIIDNTNIILLDKCS